MISVDGITRFCEDLEVDPTDMVVLSISYYMVSGALEGVGSLADGGHLDTTWRCARVRRLIASNPPFWKHRSRIT